MKISAIIPTFNRPKRTLTAIQSVLNQSQPVSEIIVIDDASSVANQNALKSLTEGLDIRLITHDKNKGVSAARNTGIEAAKSEWLAFLDSDDEWLPTKIEKQSESLKKTKLLFSYTEENWIRKGNLVLKGKKHKKHKGFVYKEALKLCFIGPSTSLVHQSVLKNIGLFDEDLKVCEDYDLWLRLTSKYEVDFIEEPLINKTGGHEDQLSTMFYAMDYWRLLALKKQIKNPNLGNDLKSETQKTFDKKLSILKKGCLKHQNLELLNKLEELTH